MNSLFIKPPQKSLGLIIVSLIFLCSLYFRLPHLNQPLSDHHDWITAHTLISIENYSNYPFKKHLFRLISTYPLSTNYFVSDQQIVRAMDKDGVGYYTTYPPFAAIFAAGIFAIFRLPINLLNLQILNLCLHFITTLFLFLTIYELSPKRSLFSGLVGVIVYIFSAPNLWFYTVTYSWDIFWYYLCIFSLYLIARLLNTHRSQTAHQLACCLALVNALTIYTEFQGVFFMGAIITVFYLFRLNHRLLITKSLLISAVPPLIISFTQGSLVDGLPTYFRLMTQKLNQYSSFIGQVYSPNLQLASDRYFHFLFAPLLLISLIILISYLTNHALPKLTTKQISLTCIPLISGFFHVGFMLPDIMIHEFASLIFIIPCAFIISFLTDHLNLPTKHILRLQLSIVVIMSLFVAQSLRDFNWYTADTPNDYYLSLSNQIKANLADNEVLFFVSIQRLPPQITYYTKRTYAMVSDSSEARKYLSQISQTKGKIFYLDAQGAIDHIESI